MPCVIGAPPGEVLEMNYSYFAARSDEAAAAVLDWPVVTQVPGADHDLAGLLSDVVRGVQFTQQFGHFAELLTGEEVDFESDEVVVAETDDETGIVFRVPADLARDRRRRSVAAVRAGSGMEQVRGLRRSGSGPAARVRGRAATPNANRGRGWRRGVLARLCLEVAAPEIDGEPPRFPAGARRFTGRSST